MSCLLEKELPFSWTLLQTDDLPLDFSMNHIAYSLIDQNEELTSSKGNEIDSELQRIENKVDLALQMLCQMMQASSELPVKAVIQLGADEIAWYYPDAIAEQRYQVALYLSEDQCLPIKMLVRVIKIESGWCYAKIEQQRADEQSAWERWVFRQHRRDIAMSRTQTSHI